MTTDSTNTLSQVQGFLSSIRKLAADTIQRDSVALLTDEVERRVQTLIQRYEVAIVQIKEEREESKKRNNEQIALRKRISSMLDANSVLTRDELEQSIRNELTK